MVVVNLNTDLEKVKETDCFVIIYKDPLTLDNILYKIKKSTNIEIYAKPILLLNKFDVEIENYYAQCVDKVIDLKYFDNFGYEQDSFIYQINGKIDILKHIQTETNDLALKILRYIYTRGEALMPYPSLMNKYGYSYPKIDHMLTDKKGNKLFEAFDFLANQKLLEPIFHDKCHFCNECYSAFLNFKEVCPRCFSPNINSEPLIHHFECAYVGLEHEFRRGKRFICPKCDQELFHLGVDYDKPSFVYTCHKCQHEFQEPLVQASCFNCRSIFDVDNLVNRTIFKYELTVLSENSAMFGFQNLFTAVLEDNLDIFPPHIFKRYLEIEIARIQRYKKSVSTLVSLNLSDINQIYQDINSLETIRSIFLELATLIQNFLRTTDILTTFNDVTYGILLVETPLQGAEIATSRLKAQIEELIKINIQQDYEIKYSLKEINENSDVEELMGFFDNV